MHSMVSNSAPVIITFSLRIGFGLGVSSLGLGQGLAAQPSCARRGVTCGGPPRWCLVYQYLVRLGGLHGCAKMANMNPDLTAADFDSRDPVPSARKMMKPRNLGAGVFELPN